MDAGDADVGDEGDLAAHLARHDRGLLGDREVGRAGRDDADAASGGSRAVPASTDDDGLAVLGRLDRVLGELESEPLEKVRVHAADDRAPGAVEERLRDLHDLVARLASG